LVTKSRGVNAKQAIILITLVAGFASAISYPATYFLAEVIGWRGTVRVFAAIMILAVAPILWIGVWKLEAGQIINTKELDKSDQQKRLFASLHSGF
jgi:predicted MFS family arabinose efflux permease